MHAELALNLADAEKETKELQDKNDHLKAFKEHEGPLLAQKINELRERITAEKNSISKYEIEQGMKIQEAKLEIQKKSEDIYKMKIEGEQKERLTKEGKMTF